MTTRFSIDPPLGASSWPSYKPVTATMTETMIDLGAEALRQRMQGGKQLRPWRELPTSSKRKWRDYASVVLCAARAIP